MRIIRFLDPDGTCRTGSLQGSIQNVIPGNTVEVLSGSIATGFTPTGQSAPVAKLLYPVNPPSILGIGANYRELYTSTGRPLPEYPIVFYKCANALQNPGDPIILPRTRIRAETVKFEGELCVVIGRECKNVPQDQAMEYVFGYTIANDVSSADWQGDRVGGQWAKGKSFDTFCPVGPCILTADEVSDPASFQMTTAVDGAVLQNESVGEMCFSVAQLISFLSAGFTIPAGSIILTGTPPGARFVVPGEEIDITIDGIGTLSNRVEEEQQ